MIVHLYGVLLSSYGGVSFHGRRDNQIWPVLISRERSFFRRHEVKLIGTVRVFNYADLCHSNFVAGTRHSRKRLRHDNVVIALIIRAAAGAVRAQRCQPITTIALLAEHQERRTV